MWNLERECLRTKHKSKNKESSDESWDDLSSSEFSDSNDSNSGLHSDPNFDHSSTIEKGSKVPKKSQNILLSMQISKGSEKNR